MSFLRCGLLITISVQIIFGFPLNDDEKPPKLPTFYQTDFAQINDMRPGSNNSDVDENVNVNERLLHLTSAYKENANGTIERLEENLKLNPSVPRLTRGEIMDILDNLTRTDLNQKASRSRSDYQRALMLVMPYTPKDSSSYSIEELYTKPPITHLIDNKPGAAEQTPRTTSKQSAGRPTVHFEPTVSPVKLVSDNDVKVTGHTIMNDQKRAQKPVRQLQPKPTVKIFTSTSKSVSYSKHSNHRYPETTTYKTYRSTPEMFSDFVPMHVDRPLPTGAEFLAAPNPSPIYNPPTTSEKTSAFLPTPASLDMGLPYEAEKFIRTIDTPNEQKKFSSQYNASEMMFPKRESQTENVIDILDSIGAAQAAPDVSFVADSLSPDMKKLLMSFGLIEDPNERENSFDDSKPESLTPNISSMSYTQFKPLPDMSTDNRDMEEFLLSFGLNPDRQRSAKTMKNITSPVYLSEMPKIDADMLPQAVHETLDDIGLSDIQTSESKKESHIFNPEKTNIKEDDKKKLSQLLETIKRLEKLNRTIVQDDLKDLDIENIKTLSMILNNNKPAHLGQQGFGLDPLDYDLSVQRNQVKRQKNATEPSTTEAATDEPSTQSVEALEESFGGGSSVDSTPDASLPPPRRTGFYYLVDWNSFLEVGEEGKNKVTIKFSPQAGDANRFYKVNVP